MESLKPQLDRFGGVTISLDPSKHSRLDPSEFGVQLAAAVDAWAKEGKRGIWLRVPAKVANLIDPAVMLGFDFHHAQPGYVMLTKWLPRNSPSSLPVYPHHQVGVGGLVMDGSGRRVLCIQERSGVTAGLADFWKLPGGLVDAGEDLCDAAVREVREETGIQTVFDCVATVRETQSGPFGCTDLYAVCILRLSEEAYGRQHAESTPPTPTPQESEIAAAEWRGVDELLGSKYYAKGLYGSLIRTACDVAARHTKSWPHMAGAVVGATGVGAARLGLACTRMKGLTGKPESMYYAGAEALTKAQAKL